MLKLILVLLAATLFPPPLHAAGEGPCFSEGSSALIAACLKRELRGAERLLLGKQSELIERVKRMEVPDLMSESEFRGQYVKAIQGADKQWRMLVATECGAIAPIEFAGAGAGSMGYVLELNCRISRTHARIKEIGDSDGYSYIWSR